MLHSIPNLAHNVCCVDRALNKSNSHLKEKENFSETTRRRNPLPLTINRSLLWVMLAFTDWSSTGTHYQVRYFSDVAPL